MSHLFEVRREQIVQNINTRAKAKFYSKFDIYIERKKSEFKYQKLDGLNMAPHFSKGKNTNTN